MSLHDQPLDLPKIRMRDNLLFEAFDVHHEHIGVMLLDGVFEYLGRHVDHLLAGARAPRGGCLKCAQCKKLHRGAGLRSEEHKAELQSLMRISYAVFGLKKTRPTTTNAPND